MATILSIILPFYLNPEIITYICVPFKVYASSKGNSSKSLEIDDDLDDDDHRDAEHQDNFQSSGAEDDMSD